MIEMKYADFAWEQTVSLLAIDSPSGFTDKASLWVRDAFAALDFNAHITTKGGVLVDLGGEDSEDGLLMEAHTDTCGNCYAYGFGLGGYSPLTEM